MRRGGSKQGQEAERAIDGDGDREEVDVTEREEQENGEEEQSKGLELPSGDTQEEESDGRMPRVTLLPLDSPHPPTL